MRAEQESDFLEFVAARTDRLRRFGYLCCGDWHRAEDAVQVTLVKLYAVWARASTTSVDAFARRILINTLIDEHRRGWFRRERVSDRLPDRSIVDQGDDTTQKISIMAALARLPKRQRAVVVLRYWEDLPVERTAMIMRCSTGTVKSLKGMLDEAAGQNNPQSAIDGMGLLAQGKRHVRGRRLRIGGVTAGIAVVAAGALLLPSAFASGGGQAADSSVAQPTFTLPDYQEEDGYHYQWDYVQDNFDEIAVADSAHGDESKFLPLTNDNRPEMSRDLMELNEYPGDGGNPSRFPPSPWYAMNTSLTLSGEKSKVGDWVRAVVYPKGGLKPGEGETFEYLYSCQDRKAGPGGQQPAAAKRTCEESTGPDGEQIVNFASSYLIGTDSPSEVGREVTTVVFRADGTAIVVSDSANGLGSHAQDPMDPTMTAAQ